MRSKRSADSRSTDRSAPARRLRALWAFVTDRRGATYVEYLLAAGLIAILAIAGFRRFGNKQSTVVHAQIDELDTITGDNPFRGMLGGPGSVPDIPSFSGSGFGDFGSLAPNLGGLAGNLAGDLAKGLAGNLAGNLPGQLGNLGGKGGNPGIANFAGGGCFVAGTKISAPDGLKPIEQVREGDEVWARNEESGAVSLRHVLGTYITADQPIVRVTVDRADGEAETIDATPAHLFWSVSRGWIPAKDLAAGEELVPLAGPEIGRTGITPRGGTLAPLPVVHPHRQVADEVGMGLLDLEIEDGRSLGKREHRRHHHLGAGQRDQLFTGSEILGRNPAARNRPEEMRRSGVDRFGHPRRRDRRSPGRWAESAVI